MSLVCRRAARFRVNSSSLNSIHDFLVPGAAAKVSGKTFSDFSSGRGRISI
jgi:hypothetical protein